MPVAQGTISSVKSHIKSIESNQHMTSSTTPLRKGKKSMGAGNSEGHPCLDGGSKKKK